MGTLFQLMIRLRYYHPIAIELFKLRNMIRKSLVAKDK